MKTSIVIATYNKLEYTQLCIESIREYTSQHDYEIIVVDNGSTDETVSWLRSQSDIKAIFNSENLGFPKACNQGIEVSNGDNILLLNNDTIVTNNWLTNLLSSLYSSEEIGAVGSLTNNCSYGQSIQVPYNSIEEMHLFATQYNQNSNPILWEERLKLVGYCMLIKKNVLDEVGLLDERFTPGNFEDDDLSLRIRLAGYKLLLCKDTFIHHFGSVSFKNNVQKYLDLMHTNQKKFTEKWGFDPEDAVIHTGLVGQIISAPTDFIRLLEIGCGNGGTLLSIKHHFPNTQIFGVETNQFSAKVATRVTKYIHLSLQEVFDSYPAEYFDVIIIGNLGCNNETNVSTINALQKLLNANGQFIVTVPNLMHYILLKKMMAGTISSAELQYWKLSDIEETFKKAGFVELKTMGLLEEVSSKEESIFIQQLAEMSGIGTTQPYEIRNFMVVACKSNKDHYIKSLINNLLLQKDVKSCVNRLADIDTETVLEIIIKTAHDQKIDLLNFVAIQFIEQQKPETALPFLSKAFELKPDHDPTLFNLGLAMYTLKQDQLALDWLEQICHKNNEVVQWISQIKKQIYNDSYEKNKIKFLLRRLENNVHQEESLAALLQMIENKEVTLEQIHQIVDKDMIQKSQIFTQLAVSCYEQSILDLVFPFFEKALQFDAENQDALYLLAHILYELGDIESAKIHLNRVRVKNSNVSFLMEKLSEVSTL
ncbi:glycosyltransferase [Paenibacillus oleatilyticus]|uniref:Glycosyltransferase n=1 Tax=Paenibacillus oleatilyticus TaxID=2594886 RepID=A0ABV4V7V1_9BACL